MELVTSILLALIAVVLGVGLLVFGLRGLTGRNRRGGL
ncbi:unannotated protein [freshwater metagenome]|uniref:Unannotated protein n=1 Tax=freshwater metagenome TaxID=449393 RepID=A0A6J6L0G3_9ZZZZ